MKVPADYVESCRRARARFGSLADDYAELTQIGDPMADSAVEALAGLPEAESRRLLKAAIDGCLDNWNEVPEALRLFMEEAEREPEWLDREAMRAGCAAFHRHSEMFLAAFVTCVLVEGFCTYISKSFVITGRLVDQGVKRLQQNNRHIMEIFLPGGLERQGDGWKLSVRIRLVHAQVRRLLAGSKDWDREAWGTPISAAHMAFASSVFSALLLKRARKLGVRLSAWERRGFMQVWRYSAFLMGVPERFLPADEEAGLRIYELGWACEPPLSLDSRILAHGLINSAPIVIGRKDPRDRRALAKYVFRVSRAMLGNELADKLGYPKDNVFGLLWIFRFKNALDLLARRLYPRWKKRKLLSQFSGFLQGSYYAQEGLHYGLPGHVHAEKDRQF